MLIWLLPPYNTSRPCIVLRLLHVWYLLSSGFFLFAISATTDLKNDLRLINKKAKTNRNRVQILDHLAIFIHCHWSLIQLSGCWIWGFVKQSFFFNFFKTIKWNKVLFLDICMIFRIYFNYYSWSYMHGGLLPYVV